MAGTVIADVFQSSTTGAPEFRNSSGTEIGELCRAWVNFNGTGTVAIRGSFNVSSITDNGTGNYTVNFTTAMPDVNYSAIGGNDRDGGGSSNNVTYCVAYATGTLGVKIQNSSGTLADTTVVTVAVFR